MTLTLPITFHDWLRLLARRRRTGAPGDGGAGPVWLERGAMWSLRAHPHEALALTCGDGQLWLTCEGDARDYVLGPGDTVRLEAAGHVVAQALKPTRFRVSRGPSARSGEAAACAS
ncbi:DUF2917 domain-containing protein [Pyxidicoccus fallax]|uniref:DUF2917 domain-containing protein n=1 Tax=Pyxidicoccus fallax TaxID=394095 RepID=A0A848LL19_9BACT|nr:DUF2917 domain-containing protein [Pyxidicoccus fallax]NMO18373.1 DUF2917 domain-containing protein [Pyxidicoccus fallax]NPC83097.1 DUF2917 domain-containing protein [Pyxidicoccus fallax]